MREQLGKFILDLISNHLHHSVIPIQACADFIAFAGDCEKQWAQKITVEWRKEQFLAIWGFVRTQIASYLHCKPSDIIFDRTSYGKPFLKFPAIHFSFNISHTKNHLAICYGNPGASCGIDIEIVRDMPDRLSIAERFFAKEEFLFLSQLESEKKQNDYFFKLWVIKEAILKTLGRGLSYGLDKVFIDGFEEQMRGVIDLICDQEIKKIAWQFFQEPSVDYVKAVALEME
jgi:phosphopantetheine--protein transferase-like protein